MSIDFSPLYSSSSGNCIFVRAGSANILIDAGVTAKKIVNSLNAINIDPSNIDGILLTHEHSDHIKGAGVLSRKFDIPIYANHATWDAIGNKIGDIHLKNTCEFFDSFYIDDMLIEPICIPHDAADPVCYSIGYKKQLEHTIGG